MRGLNFKVSSALKSVIGRDLITNDFVAIFELVKNSSDAGATRVDIIFDLSDSSDKENSRIYVVDDGKGMSYDDISGKWLFVAYSDKRDGTGDSSKSKIYAGNKGVGRFSCDRLGGKLKIQAKTKNDSEVNLLEVDWGKFEENPKTVFEKIRVRHGKSNDFELPPRIRSLGKGVILEISDLREASSWDKNKLLSLEGHLAKLIDPLGDSSPSFNITLHYKKELKKDRKKKDRSSDGNFVKVPIKNPIFKTLKKKTTYIQVNLKEDGYFYSSLVDRGELIYEIKEPLGKFTSIIDSGFKCQLFYLNKSAKTTFARRMSLPSTEFGSVFLFRNGFRVFPVGETGDDSWKIDRRRQQGYARFFGTRDIMGRVDISGPESKFKESSSRDRGLIETAASKELHNCVWDLCIKRLENYVVGVTWKDKLDKLNDTPKRMELDENRTRIIKLIESLARSGSIEILGYNDNLVGVLSEKSVYFEESIENLERLAGSTKDPGLRKNIDLARKRFLGLKRAEREALRLAGEEVEARKKAESTALEEKEQRVQAEEKAVIASREYEEERKRNLFLVATESRDKEQLESFLHQIVIYASSSKQKIASSLKKIYSSDKEFNLENAAQTLSDLMEITEKLITTSRFATFANFKLDSAEIKDDICLYIKQYLEKVSTAYNHRINIVSTVKSKPFVVSFTPIELGVVLDNIVNNSKKSRASQVSFEINRLESSVLEVIVEDNGQGLDRSINEPERIFEKGFTTTRGSGLGLYHCRKQIERMGGELLIPEDQPPKGFKLVMRLRKLWN